MVKPVKFGAGALGKRNTVHYVSVLHSVLRQTTFCGHHVHIHVHVQLYVYAHVYGYDTRCRTSLMGGAVRGRTDLHSVGGQERQA